MTGPGELDQRRRFLDGFCDRWLAAFNTRQTAAVLALTTGDVLWDDQVFWPHPCHGHTELAAYLDKIWTVMPDVEFTERQRFFAPDGSQGIVLFRQRGSGPPGPAAGERFEIEGCDIFLEFRDGLLSHYQAEYELSEMMRQLNMLPPRQGQIGGAYLLSLLRAGQAAGTYR
jgi:steroid delta-isomerase-like uncharacterized protein